MATRKAIANKFYVDSNGDKKNTAPEDTVEIGFDVYDPSGAKDAEDRPVVVKTITAKLKDFPKSILTQSMAMGLLQKIGDAYAGKADEATEIIETMIERLMEGDWVLTGKGGVGPQPSMLLDAIIQVLASKGVAETDELRAKVKESIKTSEQKQEALNNPEVKAAFEQLKAAKAAERAAEAAKAAAEATGENTFLQGFGG